MFSGVAKASSPGLEGNAHSILFLEKNVNPQNVMVVYTRLDTSCRPLIDLETGTATTGFYWLMDRQKYKPVSPFIVDAIKERIVPQNIYQPSPHESYFNLSFSYFEELGIDLNNINLFVYSAKNTQSQKCVAATYMKLGPEDGNVIIKIKSIYIESEKPSLFNLRPKVHSIRVSGIDEQTGEKLTKNFLSKSKK